MSADRIHTPQSASAGDLRQMLAWFRAMHASHTATLTMLADAIRETEWMLAPSVATSAPLPEPRPVAPSPAAVDPAKKKRVYTPESLERMRAHAAAMRARIKNVPSEPPPVEAVNATPPAAPVAATIPPSPSPPALPPAPPRAAPAAPPAKITRAEALSRVAAVASSERRGAGGEPILVDLAAVATWSGPRGLPCQTWDDLPAINRKREQLGLPRFARAFRRS